MISSEMLKMLRNTKNAETPKKCKTKPVHRVVIVAETAVRVEGVESLEERVPIQRLEVIQFLLQSHDGNQLFSVIRIFRRRSVGAIGCDAIEFLLEPRPFAPDPVDDALNESMKTPKSTLFIFRVDAMRIYCNTPNPCTMTWTQREPQLYWMRCRVPMWCGLPCI